MRSDGILWRSPAFSPEEHLLVGATAGLLLELKLFLCVWSGSLVQHRDLSFTTIAQGVFVERDQAITVLWFFSQS